MTELSAGVRAFGQHPKTDVDTLRGLFHEADLHDEVLKEMAHDIQGSLCDYFETNIRMTPAELTPELFEACYDPDQPTIVIDTEYTFSGVELLGLAAHEPDTRANIIYIATPTANAKFSQNGRLAVASGAMVLNTGQVVYGPLPYSVAADVFETADKPLLEQCEALGVPTFQTAASTVVYNDKSVLETLSNSTAVALPQRIDRAAFLASDDTDNIVIKPSKHSQGRGVLITDTDADAEYTKSFYKYLERNNYEPVIEERARSWKVTDTETGERLDWNVRALLSYGDLLGMYVRADNWGKPVNLSLTAQAISMKDFASYFEKEEDAEMVICKLEEAARAVAAENPASLIGADLTVNEQGQPYMFELNSGLAGGMQTIATLEKTYDDKMAIARKLLTKFIAHTDLTQDTQGDEMTSDPLALRPSFTSLAFTTRRSSQHQRLAEIPLEEIPTEGYERIGAVMALVAIRSDAYYCLSPDMQREIDETLHNNYPLEARRYVKIMMSSSHETDNLRQYIEDYIDIFPDDTEMKLMKAVLAARQLDLKEYKNIYGSIKSQLEGPEAFYEMGKRRLLDRFEPSLKHLSEEAASAFSETVTESLAAFCEADYETANTLLEQKCQLAANDPEYLKFIRSLQFCMAAGAEEFDEALRHFDVCEQTYEQPWEFHEEIVDGLRINPISSPNARHSTEALSFSIKLAYRCGIVMPTTLDAIALARAKSTDATRRSQLVQVIAETIPIEATQDERDEFHNVISKISERERLNDGEAHRSNDLPDLLRIGKLIDALFNDDTEEARVIIKYFEDQNPADGDMMYVEDALDGRFYSEA